MTGESHEDLVALVLSRDDETSEVDRERARAHLEDCFECRERLDRWSRLRSAFAGWKPVSSPDRFVSGIMARLGSEELRPIEESSWRRGFSWFSPAAGLAVAALALVLLLGEPDETEMDVILSAAGPGVDAPHDEDDEWAQSVLAIP